MTTSDDMREVKELLDDGLISQHDYDEEKRRFLRAREKSRELHIEFQKRELEVREEALRRDLALKEASLKRQFLAKECADVLERAIVSLSSKDKDKLRSRLLSLSGIAHAPEERQTPPAKRQRGNAQLQPRTPPQSAAPVESESVEAEALARPNPQPSGQIRAAKSTAGTGVYAGKLTTSQLQQLIKAHPGAALSESWLSNAAKSASCKTRVSILICAAASRGYLKVLKEMQRLHRVSKWPQYACFFAAEGGHLETLKWLRSEGASWNTATCRVAAERAHIRVLKWMRGLKAPHSAPCPWDKWTTAEAAKRGDIEMLEWCIENGCPWSVESCHQAAHGGHLECLKLLRESGCPWDKWVTYYAAKGGHVAMLRWAADNGCPWGEWTSAPECLQSLKKLGLL